VGVQTVARHAGRTWRSRWPAIWKAPSAGINSRARPPHRRMVIGTSRGKLERMREEVTRLALDITGRALASSGKA